VTMKIVSIVMMILGVLFLVVGILGLVDSFFYTLPWNAQFQQMRDIGFVSYGKRGRVDWEIFFFMLLLSGCSFAIFKRLRDACK
jgi:hypothetical protein